MAILGGPILVAVGAGSPYLVLYQPFSAKELYGDRFERPSFKKAVELVSQHLKIGVSN